MMGILFLQIFFFAIAILSNKWNKKPLHYFILFILSAILVTHILAYNTDAEDAYIGFRYVKNFVEGKGLVFNTFDKVERLNGRRKNTISFQEFFTILMNNN